MAAWPFALAVLLHVAAASATQIQITGTTARGWPNERLFTEPPPLAVDGDLTSFTWTTASGNQLPANLGLDFGTTWQVERIRLWKDDACGCSAQPEVPKNLTIQYTADLGPVESRTWWNVPNLMNGYLGTELLQATAVNSDGTVQEDVHDSVNEGHGWASLSFDPVAATGVRISFANAITFPGNFNHYKVHEFQAFAAPEPTPLGLLGLGAFVLVGYGWRRGDKGGWMGWRQRRSD